jgi:hypothetical protein
MEYLRNVRTSFPTYNRIRRRGIRFNCFYIINNERSAKHVNLLKLTGNSSELFSVGKNMMLENRFKMFSKKVYMRKGQLDFLNKLAKIAEVGAPAPENPNPDPEPSEPSE